MNTRALSVLALCCLLDYFSTVLSGLGLFTLLPPLHTPHFFSTLTCRLRVAAPGSQWNWSRVFNVQRQACCLVLSKVRSGKKELKNDEKEKKAGRAIAELSKDSMHSTFLIYSALYASIIHALINSWLKRNIIIQPCKQIHGLI